MGGNNCFLTEVKSETGYTKYAFEYKNAELSRLRDFAHNSLPEGMIYNVDYITRDSLIIRADYPGSTPILSAKYDGNLLVELREFTGDHYLYKFSYYSEKIQVQQYYFSYESPGLVRYQKVAYADYFFDTNNNVRNMKEYRYDTANSQIATLYNNIVFTYDTAYNPLKGNIYLNFWVYYNQVPLASFFNTNNILSKTINDQNTLNFDYEYDAKNNTTKGGIYPTVAEYYAFECF
ncbi:hypothetical protein GCM10022260_20660 [Gaetbulibacter aestuarii]